MNVSGKLVCLLGMFIFYNLAFSQYKNDYFIDPDTDDLAKYQFDFSKIEKKLTLDEKVDLYVEQVVLKDTDAVSFYTGINTYAEFQELRKDKKAFYKQINAEHHAKNLHVLDLNQDGLQDFIFNYFSMDETTYIKIFINKGTYYSSQRVPGHFIVNFSRQEKVYFETFAWSCCMDPYRHYYISTFRNDSLIKEKHVQIPINLSTPDKIPHVQMIHSFNTSSITFPEETKAFESPKGTRPLSQFGKPLVARKDQNLDIIAEIKENKVSYYLVHMPVVDERNPAMETSVLAWLHGN